MIENILDLDTKPLEMSMEFCKKLPIPMEIKQKYPLSRSAVAERLRLCGEISDIILGRSQKKLAIVGPCSADREDAVLEYCERLRDLSDKVSEKLVIIARVYTGKPRTRGSGYLGMIHQPDLDRAPSVFDGILAARRLHTSVIEKTGLPTADELLYPQNFRYFSDILSYTAVGARSVENQEHRFVASGISIPVGMKNPTSGDLSVMINSVSAAKDAHDFIYRGWEVKTRGNPLAHAVLRGGFENGKMKSNCGYDDIVRYISLCGGADNAAFIVDASHANSGKCAERQIDICRDVLDSVKKSGDISFAFKGFMIESYLFGGSQPDTGKKYGVSITDPCLGFEETERLILDIADNI